MFELVFGPDSNFVLHSKSPVDRQLDRLLQSTWKKQAAAATTTSTPAAAEDEPSTRAAITKHPFATPAENHPTTTVAAGATHGAFFLKQTIATATQDDICVYPPPASIATNSYAYYYPSAPTDASTVSTSTTFSSLDESRSGCVADVGVDDVDCSKIRGTVDPKNHNNNNTNSVSSSISSKSNGSIGSSSQGRHDGYSVELKRCNSLPELHRHPSSMDTVVEEMDTAEE